MDIDLRVGGTWRFVMVANAGFEVAFHGEYRELVPAERMVWTEVFEGHARRGGGVHDHVHRGRRPHARSGCWCSTPARSTGTLHINSGMEDGLQEALNLLEQVARSLR